MYDIGANLCNDQFKLDLPAVLARAKKSGLKGLILTTTNEKSWHQNQAILNRYQNEYYLAYTLGVHPHHAQEGCQWVKEILEEVFKESSTGNPNEINLNGTKTNEINLNGTKTNEINLNGAKTNEIKSICAIGETGLDYFRDLSPRPIQRACLEYLIEQSSEYHLPIFLHEREAHDDMIAMLKNSNNKEKKIIHCFTGNTRQAEQYLNLDCSFGVATWICDNRRNQALKEAVKIIPLEKIMLETDSPYLLPPQLQKTMGTTRNEPSFIHLVTETVANIKGISVEEVQQVSQQNTLKFFKLSWPTDSFSMFGGGALPKHLTPKTP